MSIAIWICAVLTVISAGVSAGYAIAGLRASAASSHRPGLPPLPDIC